MKCEGRPDGPCPDNRNDGTVHNTIGDLFLCYSCEEHRWPTVASTVKATKANKPTPTSKNTKTAPTGVATCKAATKQAQPECSNTRHSIQSAKLKVSEVPGSEEGANAICGQCLLPVENRNSRVIKCDTCRSLIHQYCTHMSEKVFDIFIKIKTDVGWVCTNCRELLRARGNDLQTSIATLSEEVARVKGDVADIKEKLSTVASTIDDRPVTQTVQGSTDNVTASQTQREVYRTYQDITRRKHNVVVSGIPETYADDGSANKEADKDTFIKLCEENLSVKPALAHKGCVRLGKADGTRPRRLLVHLTSEVSAANLLAASKALRQSDDTYVSKNVYINPDLSPVEEKMAYERRLQRRQRRHATAAVTATVPRPSTSLNVDAEPYVDRSAAVDHSATLSVSTTPDDDRGAGVPLPTTGSTGDSVQL